VILFVKIKIWKTHIFVLIHNIMWIANVHMCWASYINDRNPLFVEPFKGDCLTRANLGLPANWELHAIITAV